MVHQDHEVTTTTTTTTILLLFIPKRKIYVCPANSQKASHGGASRYKNNFNKNKLSCKPLTEINRKDNIQKLNEVNTALTEEKCIMT